MTTVITISTNGRKSNGASALAEAAGIKRWFGKKPLKPTDVLINWGSTKPYPEAVTVINPPYNVGVAANKVMTFSVLGDKDVDIVPWTSNIDIVKEWLAAGHDVVVRATVTGHSGEGITIIHKGDDVPVAPLYTRYVKKDREFRVHATTKGVILTQRKIRDPGREPTNWQIRSHQNGFIFAVKNVEPNEARDKLAMAALEVMGLDFGAVDIIEKAGQFYVLEVNTAPGLEGNTLKVYADALKELANGTDEQH